MAIIKKEKALDVIRQMVTDGQVSQEVAEKYFPELKESKESEGERIRKWLICYFKEVCDNVSEKEKKGIITWLEKQATPQVRTGIEWVNTIDNACDKRYAEEYAHGEYCHEQSFKWGFQEGVDWLEKQGEQKETLCDKCKKAQPSHSCQDITTLGRCAVEHKQKSADKVELKFHEGDWVTSDGESVFHVMIDNNMYQLETLEGTSCHFSYEIIERKFRPWTIQDAKDGDVLVDEDNNIGIYKEIEGLYWNSYIYLGCDGKLRGFSIGGSHKQANTRPATKEQRDTFFAKMKEAGYEWDAEKKELKYIDNEEDNGEDYGIDSLWHAQRILEKTLSKVDGYQSDDGILEHKCAISAVKKLYEQNPAWSEEDKDILFRTINDLKFLRYTISIDPKYAVNIIDTEREINWLKSLKDRIQPQLKQEWSEEDENNILFLTSIIEECFKDKEKITLYSDTVCANFTKEDVIDRLKSLRPQSHWKPSDEQMDALRYVTNFDYGGHKATLVSLYEQLRKLTEK